MGIDRDLYPSASRAGAGESGAYVAVANGDRYAATRSWFAKRRESADSSEIVFAVFDRTAASLGSVQQLLTSRGFRTSNAVINVNTTDGVRQLPLSCLRATTESTELSFYALDTDPITTAVYGTPAELAARATAHLTAIFGSADVLICFLDVGDPLSESGHLADLGHIDALISSPQADYRAVFIVGKESVTRLPEVETAMASLEDRYASEVVVLRTKDDEDNDCDSVIRAVFEHLDGRQTGTRERRESGARYTSRDVGVPASVDSEIERVIYEFVVRSGARRAFVFDDSRTLLETIDNLKPDRDWSESDSRLKLQLAGIGLNDLHALTVGVGDAVYSVQSVGSRHELFAAAIWSSNQDASLAAEHARGLAIALSETIARYSVNESP